MLPEPLSSNLSTVNHFIVILEYVYAIQVEKTLYWKNLVIQFILVVK